LRKKYHIYFKLELVGAQEVRWDRGGTEPAGQYTFFLWKGELESDHIFIDMRRHSSILDVRSFRAADCDADHYLVVAKVRERLAVHI
jgi:hypothetical protein